ncbi:IS1 family transposase [Chroococcidiopsis sp. CCNUC1]|uniref:IS1 family transposase n=1 Tax=Chroococcidiopsis sp. CCNUC1 TaxID=2653189 RepID=UPI003531F9AD
MSWMRCGVLSEIKLNKGGCGTQRDHATGKVLAYVFGTRKDEAFLQLKALLSPFGISRFYTDDWGAYERHLDASKHEVGKHNTQKIENKHLNLRTRIKRLAKDFDLFF